MRLSIYGGSIVLIVAGVEAVSLPEISPWSPLELLQAPICVEPTRKEGLDYIWEGLETCNRDACIFANRKIGGGMILVTTERNANLVSKFPDPPQPPPGPLPFLQAIVPGKGLGLIANRTIHKGELIMVRPVTMMVQKSAHTGLDPEKKRMLYERAVGRLPDLKRDLFMGQMGRDIHDKDRDELFSGIYR